ncbi:MAG: Bax inhibitor-1/YccA family protein [Bacteroides sp.]|nr:Bax inhibitor-1/YccA family protein [Bacteroides sp.]MCM1550883.1 Bax inhibitor-1/YccA family protein [Clostridium sp.]
MENNPYGFHTEENQSQSNTGYNRNETNYYQNVRTDGGAYADSRQLRVEAGFGNAGNLTARRKKCLIMSLAIMCVGLIVSTVSAFLGLVVMALLPNLFLPILIGSIILELSMVFATNHCIRKNKVGGGIVCYTLFAIANGTTFLSIFLSYAPSSILAMFLVTTVIFGGTALVALMIPKDLSRWSTSLIMGLFALLALTLLYFIFPMPALDLFICIFGIVLFIGITVYDIKKIQGMATENPNMSVWSVGLFGGMNLYLDFVNLLLKILRLFGRRSD